MADTSNSKAVSDSYFDEIEAAIEIRSSYKSIVIANSQLLLSAFSEDPARKQTVLNALRHKESDASALYKALIVQTNGIFEYFIKTFAMEIVSRKFSTTSSYEDLSETFKKQYVSHVAAILVYIKEGSVKGSPYNFDELLENFVKIISKEKQYNSQFDVFTRLMGNCTSDRLKKLFEVLEVGDIFGHQIGIYPKLSIFFSEKSNAKVAKQAKEKLDEQIDLRNDIVHGNLTLSISIDTLRDSLNFFRDFVDDLYNIAKKKTAV